MVDFGRKSIGGHAINRLQDVRSSLRAYGEHENEPDALQKGKMARKVENIIKGLDQNQHLI